VASSVTAQVHFGPHQRARHVESVFRQQVREVVARHAARNVRKPAADFVTVPISDALQPRVNLAASSALRDDALIFIVRRCPDMHSQPVIGENIELDDILFCLSRHHRMGAAGIVADHAAECVVVVSGGVGSEG
jgi:hypothetical protein